MRKRFSTILLSVFMGVCCMLSLTACGCNKTPESLAEQNRMRSIQMAKAAVENYIDKDLYKAKKDEWQLVVNMHYDPFKNEQIGGACTIWDYTGFFGMVNRTVAISKGYDKSSYKKFVKYQQQLVDEMVWYEGSAKIRSYQSERTWTAYGVNRAKERGGARIHAKNSVYDDQMWLIREFVAAYNDSGKADYLAEAENLTAYVLDGWDASINPASGKAWGGITWGPGYYTKHTCSNAPVVSALVKLHQIYKDSEEKMPEGTFAKVNVTDTYNSPKKSDYYLNWAKTVYEWTYTNLRNSDDTFADLIGTEYGSDPVTGYKTTTAMGGIDSTRYSYNTGAMISGAAALFGVTGDQSYLDQAGIMAEAAYRYFGDQTVKEGYVQYPITSDTINFNLILLQGFYDLAPYDASVDLYIKGFQDSLDYAYDNFYLHGALPRDLLNGWLPGYERDSRKMAMDSAAYAEMYGILYQFEELKAARQTA